MASLLMIMITSMKHSCIQWGSILYTPLNYSPNPRPKAFYLPLLASKFQFQKEAIISNDITMFTVKSLILTEEPLWPPPSLR